MTREPYLYQTLHVLDGVCAFLPEHLSVLDGWSRQLFGRPFRPDRKEFAAGIATLAAQSVPAGCDRSLFVRLYVPASAEPAYRLEFESVSLYRGYDLRSLQPRAATLQYDIPLVDAPTSARDAAEELARRQAQLLGAAVAVRCNAAGLLRTADDAPLFAIRHTTVLTPPAPYSVERELAMQAVLKAGFELCEEEIDRSRLPEFDELFYVDHRGLTALSRCDGQPYMTLFAERIAKALSGELPSL